MSIRFLDAGVVHDSSGVPGSSFRFLYCRGCQTLSRFTASIPVVEIAARIRCRCKGRLRPVDANIRDAVVYGQEHDLFAIRGHIPYGPPTRAVAGRKGRKKKKRKDSGGNHRGALLAPVALPAAVISAPAVAVAKKDKRPKAVLEPVAYSPGMIVALGCRSGTRIPAQPSGMDNKFWYHDIYLKSELWREIRHRVLMRDRGRCVHCQVSTKIVHHLSYAQEVLAGRDDNQLVSVCGACHDKYHPDKAGDYPGD